jgi:putative ATPase
MDLFASSHPLSSPLADRMRPAGLDELEGQGHLTGPGGFLRRVFETGELVQSVILWGPPGSGKTSLAMLLREAVRGRFVAFSAVTSGVKEVRRICAEAAAARRARNEPTLLFVDEIHRFNKAQQDAFLPHVEKGTIMLVGATTENPSFEVVAPLLSRSKVLVLERLGTGSLVRILERALEDRKRGLGGRGLSAERDTLEYLAHLAGGDARSALNGLEVAASLLGEGETVLGREHVETGMQRSTLLYDKAGEEHYNLISALHKSMRGGDAQASLYWLGRMLEAGEDPLYVARRLVRFASEDVGNADPGALGLAVAAQQAVHFIGLPEGKLALAQAVSYLALAPKSNALDRAYARVRGEISRGRVPPVPHSLRNPVTPLMEDQGYGEDYRYPHDAPDAIVDQAYLPEELEGASFYEPTGRGFEKELRERIRAWREARRRLSGGKESNRSRGGKPRRKQDRQQG